MKALSFIKKILTNGCIYFTVGITILYTAGTIASNYKNQWIPNIKTVYMLLLFSIILSMVNYILKIKKLSLMFRLIVHFITVATIYYIIFIYWGGFSKDGSATILAMLFYAVIYILIALIIFGIKYINNLSKNKRKVYKSKFSSNEDSK